MISLARIGTRCSTHLTQASRIHSQNLMPATPISFKMQALAAARSGLLIECLRAAQSMKMAGVSPDMSIYDALLSAAAREGSWLFAWAIFDDMVLSGTIPTATTIAHLIEAQRTRRFENYWHAVAQIHRFGIEPNANLYSSIIQTLVDGGKIELALKYFIKMKKKDLVPAYATAQAIIILAAKRDYSRMAIDLAKYFEELSLRRLEDSTWIACLASSSRNLYGKGVLTCWSIVVHDLKLVPNEGLCLSVLNTAARLGLPELATEVLTVLKLVGVDWQEHHFSALIESFTRNNQFEEAFATLHVMDTNGATPIDSTTSFIFDCIKKDVDSLDAAWAVIDQINSSGTGLHISALKVVIRASIFLGDLQRAVGIYKSFSAYGFLPDIGTFNLLLEGCINARHRQLGDVLLSDMKQHGITPNEETYEKVIQLCLTQATYEDAFYYLEEMKAANYLPPRRVYEALAEKCSSVKDPRNEMVLQEMKECGYELV